MSYFINIDNHSKSKENQAKSIERFLGIILEIINQKILRLLVANLLINDLRVY